jgi:hypothetical protein
MARATYTADEILAQLDECAEQMDFPMLDNGYVYPGDARLSAYRDDRRWAVLIEVLGFHYKCGVPDGIYVAVHTFGNCVRGEVGLTNDDFLYPVAWEQPEDAGYCDVPPDLREVFLRGKPVPVPRDPAVYKRKKIDIDDPFRLEGQHLLRALLPEHRDELLATEAELRRRIPGELPLFVRLDAWKHPDLADDQAPSALKSFRTLAGALVEGDPNRVSPGKPNTHWKHWPEGGTL